MAKACLLCLGRKIQNNALATPTAPSRPAVRSLPVDAASGLIVGARRLDLAPKAPNKL